MRCYLVSGGSRRRYASTQALAKAAKKELAQAAGIKEREMVVEQVDVPLVKEELVNFINALCEELDPQEAE